MPQFEYDSASIYFEEYGSGFPLLLIAPGAMNSIIEMWANATINPLALYEDTFRLIAMDQRNAGRSSGPLEPSDPWGGYARDQLALLDHLSIGRFHVMGCCIGGSFALKLIQQAPGRVAAAVLQQPIGITDGNGPLYEQMWRSWGDRLSNRPDLSQEDIEKFGTSLAQALKVYADALRTRRRLRAEAAVGKAGIKMLFPIVVFILPVLFVITLVPGLLSVLKDLKMLGAAR